MLQSPKRYRMIKTDTALNSYTDEEITIRTVGIIYNQHKLNLEILKQVYQINSPARSEDTGGTCTNNDDNEGRTI